MLNHLLSLLPRLKEYSKSLDDFAVFADVPWAFIDGDGDKVTYLFRRNNELLVSKRGDVATGRWEYLSVIQSMLIEYNGKKSIYNQGFVDNVVMALLKDGTEELFLLANVQKLPDLNVVGYLERKMDGERPAIGQPKIEPAYKEVRLKESSTILLIENKDTGYGLYPVGSKVIYENKCKVQDGKYLLSDNFGLDIQQGKIRAVKHPADDDAILVFIFTIIAIFLLLPMLVYVLKR